MKKPGLSILLGMGHPDEDGGGDNKASAAKDILRAIRKDDAEMFSEALSAFLDLHQAEEDDEDADEERGDASHNEEDS